MKVKSLILALSAALTLTAAQKDPMDSRIFSLLKTATENTPQENVLLSPYSVQ